MEASYQCWRHHSSLVQLLGLEAPVAIDMENLFSISMPVATSWDLFTSVGTGHYCDTT